MMDFAKFAAKVSEDARLSDLIARYDADSESLTDEELSEMVDRSARIEDEDEDMEFDDYYEDWDNLELGFDPYTGCYSDDC